MSTPMKPRPRCLVCGQPVKRLGREFCSRQCSGVVKRQGAPQTCPICATTFSAPPSTVAAGRAEHCSTACRREAERRRRELPPCAYCGKARVRRPHQSLAQTGPYCSHSCARRATVAARPKIVLPPCIVCGRTVKRPGRQHCSYQCAGGSRRQLITRACPICGTEYEVLPSALAAGVRVTCSVRCGGVFRQRRVAVACQRCGAAVEVQRGIAGRRHYCSACRQARALHPTRICAQCAKPFTVYPSAQHRKYCGWECYRDAHRPQQVRCAAARCRTRFPYHPGRQFCSLRCANRRPRQRAREEPERNARILELKAAGLNANAIAAELAADVRCVAGPAGAPWRLAAASVRSILARVQPTSRPRTRARA